MTLLDRIAAVVKEPPPAYAFEVSAAGIAAAFGGQKTFRELPPGTIVPSPVQDNVLNPDAYKAAVTGMFPGNGSKKRRTAALILPDYAARVQVLDFDSFPGKPEEQTQLIRFRVKKTTPFDIDSASISFHSQPVSGGGYDVVTAIVSLEILARYEAPFRAAGYHTGLVTTSSLAAMTMAPDAGVSIFAKLGGRTLTATVMDRSHIKLIRCVELEQVTPDEVMSVLHPTVAYVEDEFQARPDRVVLCGFGEHAHQWGPQWEGELGLGVEQARSSAGVPGPNDAGLVGMLQDGVAA